MLLGALWPNTLLGTIVGKPIPPPSDAARNRRRDVPDDFFMTASPSSLPADCTVQRKAFQRAYTVNKI
jgi:hypothetical protein